MSATAEGCPTFQSPTGNPISPGALFGQGINAIMNAGGMVTGGIKDGVSFAGGLANDVGDALGGLFRDPAMAASASSHFKAREMRRQKIEYQRLQRLARQGDRKAQAKLQNLFGVPMGPIDSAADAAAGAGKGLLNGVGGLLGDAGCATIGIGCSKSNQAPPSNAFVDICNTVTAAAFVSVVLDCDNSLSVGQSVDIECGTGIDGLDLPDTAGCLACQAAVTSLQAERKKLVDKSGLSPEDESDPASEVFKQLNLGDAFGTGLGVCAPACESCVASNINQRVYVKYSSLCRSESDWTSLVKDQIDGITKTAITQITDALGQVASVLAPSQQCIQKEISTAISSRINDAFVTEVRSQLEFWQNMKVADGSTSVWLAKASEGLNISTYMDVVAKTKVFNNIYTDQQMRSADELLQQNDTFKEFANDVGDLFNAVGNIFSSTIGLMILIMAVVLAGAVLVFGVIMVLNPEAAKALLGLAL